MEDLILTIQKEFESLTANKIGEFGVAQIGMSPYPPQELETAC